MKSTSDNNDLIYHKPLHDSKYISLDAEKKPVKLPKNRRPLKCESAERKSALTVRLILKQVCVEFLNAAYNPLMLHIRECFHRGSAQENDESYYFTAMRFFMEFNRHYNFKVKYVSETLSVQTFQFIQKYLETWHDMMTTDKKKLPLWSYRSHLALRAYKELLHNLAFMDRSEDESVRESSKVIKSNIFYVLEYREMLLTLVNLYKREKYSKKYLVDLLETIHIFIKLLCDYCKDKKMVIQKTATRRKKKNKQKKSTTQAQDQASLETIWNLACDEIALTLGSNIECDVVPFDATLEQDMNQQKLEAIKKIQFHLKNGDNKQAVAMLRASRDVWPENDTFGATTADTTEELEILKDIFFADLGIGNDAAALIEENAEGSDEEDEEDNYPSILEQNFEVIDFLKRFASPKIVKICNTLLSTFETNSETTNHCIVRMLYRIAWECKLPAMLFQASLFIKFRNILSNYEPKYKELAKLAVYILRKFTEVAATNKTVFVELLFPKHVKDACEIVDGYGSYQDSKNKRVAWEEHEEEELRRLDEEYTRTNVTENKVDWILDNLINKDRSKIGVTRKMKELGLEIPQSKPKGSWKDEEEEELRKLYEECDKDLPDKLLVSWIHEKMTSKEHNERSIKKKMYELGLLQKPLKKLKEWSSEQDEELTELFEEFKTSDDVMGPIMGILGSVRSRQNVVGALLRLGLITDKSQLRKKSKKPRKSKSNQGNHSDADSDDDESDDESGDESDQRSAKNVLERSPPVGPSAAAVFRELSKTKYLLGGLKWLVGALNDNLEDLDAEDYSDIPLLPLSEEPVLSMENAVFHDFLQALGFKKPIPNQEVYWRLAAHWKEPDIRTRIEALNCFVDNVDKELEDISDVLNEKLSTAVGEAVDVLEGSSDSAMTATQEPNSEDFNAIVQKECQRVLKKERKKSGSSSEAKPKKHRMQDFLMEEGRSGDESDGHRSARSRDASSSSEDNAPKSSSFGKKASRRRLSSESDVDDPGSPGQNGAEAVEQDQDLADVDVATHGDDTEVEGRRFKTPKKASSDRALSSQSDGETSDGRGSTRKATSVRTLRSDSEEEDIGNRDENNEEGSDEDVGRLSAKRKLSSNSSDLDAHNHARKKRNVLDSDDEESGSESTSKATSTSLANRRSNNDQSSTDDVGMLSQGRVVPMNAPKSTEVVSGSEGESRRTNGWNQDGVQPQSKPRLTNPESEDLERLNKNGDVPVKAKKRSAVLDSDSEDDWKQDGNQDLPDPQTTKTNLPRKKPARIIDSDDDE